jgi:thiopeptide-type bacteriocin biosynthesis protein
MSNPFVFHPNVVVRTPRLPFSSDINEEAISSLIYEELFMESIYLASPVLYSECLKYRNGEIKDKKEINKIKKSLTKYYLRTIGRCTPFGLFSGCVVGDWTENDTSFIVGNKRKRRTRFDMHYLCALSQHLAKMDFIKERLLYYTNNSLYNIGDEIRYVEYKYLLSKRIHQISSVNATEYLEQILDEAQQGITLSRIKEILCAPDIDDDEINSFIDELLNAQVLTTELEPSIMGNEFQYQILSVLEKVHQKDPNENILRVIEILHSANDKLKKIDNSEQNTSTQYKEIMSLLDELGVAYEENKLFQTDLIFEKKEGGISINYQKDLLEAATILNRLNSYHTINQNLTSFAKRFTERYEDEQIPLLEVLDTETGLGYLEAHGGDITPLVEDIYIPPTQTNTQNYKWTPLEIFFEEKLKETLINREAVIKIKDEDLNNFQKEKWDDLPPSMHLLFRLVGDENQRNIFIENCGGSSAINLFGRFAHADNKIYELGKEIAKAEETLNEDVIFAEIIHLPESRIGNVLLHPEFRQYEIPYLAKPSVGINNQIQVQDILVGVKHGGIYLIHRDTGKIIIPRLSNAHNFHHNALPVYQFLCDLQTYQLRGSIGFHWGSLRYIHKFLPRVQYKSTILSPATWHFNKRDFDFLFIKNEELTKEQLITDFQKRNNLPDRVVLADSDNELFIDFNNTLTINLFIETIKNRNVIELKEFLGVGNVVKNELGEYFNNQILASLIKTTSTYKINSYPKTILNEKVSRAFVPGSEWLYYKIYCGSKSADRILIEAIKPVIEKLFEDKIIDKFFFIRYNDPGFHIRFRVKLLSKENVGKAISTIYSYLNAFQSTSHIWKLQIDTYNREIERYGTTAIDIAESVFYYDSLSVLNLLVETSGDEREHVRWLWAMRSIDELINSFEYNLKERLGLINFIKEAFAKEFNVNRFLKEQLNAKFRKYRKEIENIMEATTDIDDPLHRLIQIIKTKSVGVRNCYFKVRELEEAGELNISVNELLISYIHMLVNRIATSKPRLHEMVIYDFLYRYYRAQAGRNGIQVKEFQSGNVILQD